MFKMLIILIFPVVVFITSIAMAAEYKDVVYLKNGSVVKGVIIENVINEKIRLETSDGSVFVFKYNEILKVQKEKSGELAEMKDIDLKKAISIYESSKKSHAIGCLIGLFVPGGQHFYAGSYGYGVMYLLLGAGTYAGMYYYSNKYDKTKDSPVPNDSKSYEKNAAYFALAFVIIRVFDVIHGYRTIEDSNTRLRETLGIQKSFKAGFDYNVRQEPRDMYSFEKVHNFSYSIYF
jgi:hypothetical protein